MTDRTQNIGFNPSKPEDLKTEKNAPTPRKGKKDFKKIFVEEEREEQGKSKNREFSGKPEAKDSDSAYEDVELKLEAYDQKPKTKGLSLFDIASTPVEKEEAVESQASEGLPLSDIPEDLQKESLSALFKGYGTKEKLAMIQKEVKELPNQPVDTQIEALKKKETLVEGLGENGTISALSTANTPQDDLQKPLEKAPANREKTDTFSREQVDLAAINPAAGTLPTAPVAQTQKVAPPPIRAQELQEVVDQIVSKLYTLSSEGKTDTLIQLKHPPLFEGSSVVIRSFDSAKGEFNITFENLTQAAKQMLDMQENQNSLRLALEQKGYTVHILTATTLSETTQIVESQDDGRERHENNDESSRERQQQEQEEETT